MRSTSEALQLFITTHKLHKQYFDRRMSDIGIHSSQHRILMYLSQNKDGISQKEIAEHFNISPAAVAVSLKKLENEGYILRETQKADNRINNVFLTSKANEVVKKTIEYANAIEEQIFEEFSEKDLEVFCEYLSKMQNTIDKQLATLKRRGLK